MLKRMMFVMVLVGIMLTSNLTAYAGDPFQEQADYLAAQTGSLVIDTPPLLNTLTITEKKSENIQTVYGVWHIKGDGSDKLVGFFITDANGEMYLNNLEIGCYYVIQFTGIGNSVLGSSFWPAVVYMQEGTVIELDYSLPIYTYGKVQ